MRTIRKVTDISKARKKAKKGGWGLKKVSGSFYQTERLPKPKTMKKSSKKRTSKKTAKKTSKRTTQKKKVSRSKSPKQYERVIQGKTYYGRFVKTKSEANSLQFRAKSAGIPARIAKVKGGYSVFTTER